MGDSYQRAYLSYPQGELPHLHSPTTRVPLAHVTHTTQLRPPALETRTHGANNSVSPRLGPCCQRCGVADTRRWGFCLGGGRVGVVALVSVIPGGQKNWVGEGCTCCAGWRGGGMVALIRRLGGWGRLCGTGGEWVLGPSGPEGGDGGRGLDLCAKSARLIGPGKQGHDLKSWALRDQV